MKLALTIKNENDIEIYLKRGRKVTDKESLTISQGFDNMLITAIDRLLIKNRINKLSLKSLKIPGKIRPEAVSSMIIKTIKTSLDI